MSKSLKYTILISIMVVIFANLFVPYVFANNIEDKIDVTTNINEYSSTQNKGLDNLEEKEYDGLTSINKDTESVGVKYTSHVQNIGWQEWKKDGKIAGTEGLSLRLEGMKINLTGLAANVNIKYQTHIENIGWQEWKKNGEMAGTEGKNLRLEAIKVKLEESEEYSVMYRVHVQNVGWQEWKKDGEIAGTEGKSLRLEAIQIKVIEKEKKARLFIETEINNITYYSPSTINIAGWRMANFSNNKVEIYVDNDKLDENNIAYHKRDDVIKAISGYGNEKQNPTPGFTAKIDGSKLLDGEHRIKINIVTSNSEIIETYSSTIVIDTKLHVQYRSHVEKTGWMSYVKDGEMAGTEGKSLRVEAMNIELINASTDAKILYRTHVQNIGWQDWKQNGELTGTEGKSLRIEAIQIKLENMDEYTVEYKVHIQDKGWTEWYADGDTAGTVGKSKRIEAIQIRLVPHYNRYYKGIDVSKWNGEIDWTTVRKQGIDFAIARVGYGREASQKDATFEANYSGARSEGINVGTYLYSYAKDVEGAKLEAYNCLNWLDGRELDLPVFYDLEDDSQVHLDKQIITDMAITFCEIIHNEGYKVGVYANKYWLQDKIDVSQLPDYCDIWLAHYTGTLDPINNPSDYKGEYQIWQYTSSGTVSGINGDVDMNLGYKEY